MKRKLLVLAIIGWLLSGCVHVSVQSGNGSVTIGGGGNAPTTTPAPSTVTTPSSFTTTSLRVVNVLAEVNVIVEPRANMEVTTTGRSDVVASIATTQAGGTLVVDGGSFECSQGKRIDGLSWYSINNSTLVVDNVACRLDEATVTVRVPSRSPLELKGLFGYAKIGDLNAALSINHAGSSNVDTGSISQLNVDMTGTGSITVASITGGPVDVDVTGTGNVSVNGGQAASLKADITGTGDVRIDAEVIGEADVEVTGTGDVTLRCVRGRISKDMTGTGDISILNNCP